LPEPCFPVTGVAQDPARKPSGKADWTYPQVCAKSGPGSPHLRSRSCPVIPSSTAIVPGHKCNGLMYCWPTTTNQGYDEDGPRSIDWLHDNGCRVLALMGGEPLLRPDIAHKGRLLRGQKGLLDLHRNQRSTAASRGCRSARRRSAAVFTSRSMLEREAELAEAFVPGQKNLEYLIRKQRVRLHGVSQYQHLSQQSRRRPHAYRIRARPPAGHRLHINETPMLEQDEHFSISTRTLPTSVPKIGGPWTNSSTGSSERTKRDIRW